MTPTEWLACALIDVERRDIPELPSLLEAIVRSTASLRNAAWNADASGREDTQSHEANAR